MEIMSDGHKLPRRPVGQVDEAVKAEAAEDFLASDRQSLFGCCFNYTLVLNVSNMWLDLLLLLVANDLRYIYPGQAKTCKRPRLVTKMN
jgi:hypothetical protein